MRTIFQRSRLDLADSLSREGVVLRSLAEPWVDTTSPSGKMVLTVFAGMAEFERSLIIARTSTGRLAAQQKGVRFGRPQKLSAEQIAWGRRLLTEGTSVRRANHGSENPFSSRGEEGSFLRRM